MAAAHTPPSTTTNDAPLTAGSSGSSTAATYAPPRDLDIESAVDVDWLYRSKKKKKASSIPPVETTNQEKKKFETATAAAPSTPISPTVASPTSTVATTKPLGVITPATEKPPTSPAGEMTATPQSAQATPSKSILSRAIRPRSTSDPRRGLHPSHEHQQTTTMTNSELSRSNSLNTQKPIKSLFSAFSKFKGRSAPSSPQSQPLSIPKAHHHGSAQHSQQEPNRLSSSIESISPTLGPVFLPPPHKKLETLNELSSSGSRVVLNKNPNRSQLPIRDLATLKLQRVTFALDKLPDDPPQQIPSRRPRKGNVISLDDLHSEPLRLSLGITNETKLESAKYDEREIQIIKATQRKALEESEKHAQEAHRAAQRIAHEVANFKNKGNATRKNSLFGGGHAESEVEEEQLIVEGMSNVEIDKPIHLHEHHFGDEITNNEDLHIAISLENIYTRCCHLREILPIPATLKQLKGKSAPLQTLKLLNPKPTLIDVYSFCDFIAIVAIKNVVFDNVTMTTEMLKIILSSLMNSTEIEKLSLRNVPIDNEGWKYLCKFLSRNKSISKLDISQQKIKSDVKQSQIRSEMDWNLFIDTLALRGGLEELIVNGCRLSVENFNHLITKGAAINTKRLGLAQMELSLDHLRSLMHWLSTNPTAGQLEGLDIGFNNLNEKLHPLIKRIGAAEALRSLSINSTCITNVEDAALLIRALSRLPNLRFLDLSNLKEIFPGVLPYLNKYLPRFPNLRRIHLDFNDFSTKSISILAEIIPKCPNLQHVSITGLTTISYSGAATLYGAVRTSKTLLNLDLDYDLIDEQINSRIAVCLMRNMERSLSHDSVLGDPTEAHDDILFDGSLIAETAGSLIDKISNKTLTANENDKFSEKFLQEHFLDKIGTFREKVSRTIDALLQKQDDQHVQLSRVEKENLLRFYFLENSLAKLSELFKSLEHGEEFREKLAQHQQQQLQNTPTTAATISQGAVHTLPHQMALEVNEGKETPIDVATGRPILLRSVSQTSVQAKRQEEEEGEFHRWGFFVQQQRQILPPAEPSNHPPPISETTSTTAASSGTKPGFVLPKLPSGDEIREAVIKAKGIDSISSLIESVNNETFNLNTIYPSLKENEALRQQLADELKRVEEEDENSAIESECEVAHVDEAYDKILNDLSRVRSNK